MIEVSDRKAIEELKQNPLPTNHQPAAMASQSAIERPIEELKPTEHRPDQRLPRSHQVSDRKANRFAGAWCWVLVVPGCWLISRQRPVTSRDASTRRPIEELKRSNLQLDR